MNRAFIPSVVLVCFSPFAGSRQAYAGFTASSPQPETLTRGDRVVFHTSAQEGFAVRWFLEGKWVKDGDEFELLTGEMPAGEYRVLAIASAEYDLDVITYPVTIVPSPALYKQQVVDRPAIPSMQGIKLSRDQWWMAALSGKLSSARKQTFGQPLNHVPNFLNFKDREAVLVGSGSHAVATLGHLNEQILIRGRAVLAMKRNVMTLDTGRFVWRRLIRGQDPTAQHVVRIGSDLILSSNGNGDVVIEISGDKSLLKLDLMVSGEPVTLRCRGKETILTPASVKISFDVRQTEKDCERLTKLGEGSPDSLIRWYRDFFSDWFGRPLSDFEQFLRLDRSISQEPKNTDEWVASLMNRKAWFSVLDVLRVIRTTENRNVALLLQRGRARRALGFRGEAETDFRSALNASFENAPAAREMGVSRSEVGDHARAREWFLKAEGWGHPERADLNRREASAALALGLTRQAVGHHEDAFWHETNESKSSEDYAAFQKLDESRLFRGDISGRLGVRSHVLPIDPEAFGDLPLDGTTNRGMVFGLNGHWSKAFEGESNPGVSLRGEHQLEIPALSTLSAASVNDHTVRGVISGWSGPMSFDGALGVGTNIRGGERQTDNLEAKVGLMSRGRTRYGLAIQSVRAFDPNPGGADTVDARLNLLTGGADHSHFDFGISVLAESSSVYQWWDASAKLTKIDFRTGVLDELDAQEIAVGGGYGFRMYRRAVVDARGTFVKRSFASGDSDDLTTIQLRSGASLLAGWQAGAYLEYLTRRSSLKAVTYSGHEYGLFTSLRL